MTWFKRWIKIVLFIVTLVLLLINSSIFPILKSYAVMFVYSQMHERESFLYEEEIRLQLQGGLATWKKDYFPFVIAFDASKAFSRYIDEPIDLTIYYNFGAFDVRQGASSLYNQNSPFYSTFYGAYAIRYKDSEEIYGLRTDQKPDIEAITKITDFDLKHLVYNSIGHVEPELKYKIENNEEVMVIDGREFIVFDATIQMDGMWHQYERDYRAYIQYGKPPIQLEDKESFEAIEGFGRIYLHYDDIEGISYFFYIITADKETLQYTEEAFIANAKITKKH